MHVRNNTEIILFVLKGKKIAEVPRRVEGLDYELSDLLWFT